jgi:hypothetical protein
VIGFCFDNNDLMRLDAIVLDPRVSAHDDARGVAASDQSAPVANPATPASPS